MSTDSIHQISLINKHQTKSLSISMSDPISKLLNACEGGDLETIKSLLSPPVPVAAPAATNETPSHPMQDGTDSDESEDEEFDSMAMFHGYSHQIEKAHTECRDRWKISPLGAAIMGQQLEVVDLLLSLDANANGVIENSSLIHYTCAIGGIGGTMSHSFAEACIQKLMAAGARIDARDEFLRTPLHIAAASGLHNCIALLSGSTEQTHINVQDNRGQTALHVAARNSNHACISELLSCDANKTLQDHRGRTASHPYLNCLKARGTIIMVGGVPAGAMPKGSFALIGRGLRVAGSCIGGIRQTQEMIDFCAEHDLLAEIELIEASPEAVDAAWERCIKSDVKFRFVIDTANTMKME